MALDVNQLSQDIVDKLKPILGQRWDEVQQYAKDESSKLAITLAKIEAQRLTGALTDAQANILFDMQKNASTAVLAAVHGIGDLAAAQAFNAALETLKDPINQALGFKLL
jgi:hypothetical protein